MLIEKYKIESELIIVNYNPVPDKPSLFETLSAIPARKYLKIRIITVPAEIHAKLYNPEVRKPVPLYEYIAKNVGVRRAKGEFILLSNPDIIFAPEIIRYISRKKLSSSKYYRADRCDFHKPEQNDMSNPAMFLNNIKRNIFRVSLKGYDYELSHCNPNGTQITQIRQIKTDKKNKIRLNPFNQYHLCSIYFSLIRLRIFNYFRLLFQLNLVKIDEFAQRQGWSVIYDNVNLMYHTNSGGDFLLMHRDCWHRIHGNPENTYLGVHTDSFTIVMAAASGLKEKVFFEPVFHQDHTRNERTGAENYETDARRLFYRFQQEGKMMLKNKKPFIYNDDNWGLASYKLEEREL